MTVTALINEPVTLRHKGVIGTDARNNQIIGVTSTVDTYAYIEQTEAFEITVGRETYVTTHKVFLRPTVTATGRDELVRADGTVLELLGNPAVFRNPRLRSTSHLECNARTVSG